MSTLFDSLRQRLSQQPADVQTSNQQAAQKVLAAKSGKTKAGGIAGSNVAEQTTVDNVNTAVTQGSLAGRVQSNQMANAASQQQQKVDLAQQQLTQNKQLAETELASKGNLARQDLANREGMATKQREFNRSQSVEEINNSARNQLAELMTKERITVSDLFASTERDTKELEFRKDAAQLEQRAHLLAMSDKQYLETLRRVGEQRQLNNRMKYKEELQRVVWGDEMTRLAASLGFKAKLGASQREWEKALQQAGDNIQVDLARAALKDDGQRQVATGLGNMVSVGVDEYIKRNPEGK